MTLVFDGPRQLSWTERGKRPPGRLGFKSELIGISAGTEMLVWEGSLPEDFQNSEETADLKNKLAYPLAYGYINVGVLETGERVFAFAPHGSELWVRPEDTFPIGTLSAEDAVFFANTETALHLFQAAQILPGQRVAVWGLGIVGLLTCALLQRFHMGPVAAFDTLPERRLRAEELGLRTFSPQQASEAVRDLTAGEGFEIVLELTGKPEVLEEAAATMASEARLTAGSWYGSRGTCLNLGNDFHRKRLSLTFAQVSVPARSMGPLWSVERRRQLALELVRDLRPSRWITHRFPLLDAEKAYRLLETAPGSCLQVVLDPKEV